MTCAYSERSSLRYIKRVTYSRSCADHDDVGLSMIDHVGHVATSHLATDVRLFDRAEVEIVEIVLGLANHIDGTELGGGGGDSSIGGGRAVCGGHLGRVRVSVLRDAYVRGGGERAGGEEERRKKREKKRFL